MSRKTVCLTHGDNRRSLMLDGLRGAAAFAVVQYHYLLLSGMSAGLVRVSSES